ncbi:cell division protein DivIC [Anaerotaenia torta]|uniref:FtsB family cell division protein n=1 Tax=Anaerotaenia torta TaxID=433293 RepID=UPI003D24738B
MRRRKKKGTGIGVIAFVVLILCAIVSYRRIGLGQEREAAELKLNRLEAQKREALERKEEIAEYKAYTKTDKYIEEMAREKLGLVYEDEILFEAEK